MSVSSSLFAKKSYSSSKYCSLLLFLLLTILTLPIMASETDKSALGGFLSARLGASAEEVLDAIKKDGIQVTQDEIHSGARQIRGEYAGPLSTNQILYVIPETSKKLALIIEFYDNPSHHNQVIENLTKQLGKSLAKEITDKILENPEGLPPGIKELTMWTLEAGDINLVVRAMRFEDHLAVERLDDRFFE
jgi:hypothetical protein